jgi:hypothetical protein
MNTQLGGVPDTVPERLGPVVARSFTAVLNYMSRKEVLLAAAFAHEHEMTFRETSIPVDYPFTGSIEFQTENIRALYDYGERCAASGLLWTTPEGELHHTQAALARLESGQGRTKKIAAGDVQCPLDPVSAPAAAGQR